MEKSRLVSIILPTYNRARLLDGCIKSVLKQTYENWELIIADDCSTDETEDISKKFVSQYRNIVYYKNKKRIGLPANRNKAIDISNGEVIFFIEDDLILHPNCLKILVETYDKLNENNKVGGIAPRLNEELSSLKENFMNKNRLPFYINKYTGRIFVNYNKDFGGIQEVVTLHACSLLNKKALVDVGGYPENLFKESFSGEESYVFLIMKKKGYKLYFQPTAVADHNKVNSGGCRVSSERKAKYYRIRNHLVFLIKIYKLKSIYMVIFYLGSFVLRPFKKLYRKISNSKKK